MTPASSRESSSFSFNSRTRGKRDATNSRIWAVVSRSASEVTVAPHQPPIRTGHEPGRERSARGHVGHRSCARLPAAGLAHYEISNFARPGVQSRHNRKYWAGDPFLGVGPSAWSHLGRRRVSRLRGLGRYLEAMESGRSPVEETVELSDHAAAGEAVYLGLPTGQLVNLPNGAELIIRRVSDGRVGTRFEPGQSVKIGWNIADARLHTG